MAEEQHSDPEQSQISKISSVTAQQFQVPNPVKTKKIYFYKSGDPQFSGIRMSINSHSFKTFDSLLDNLSRKIPLPFGVRTIATPRGGNSVTSLSDLKDGQSYICSDQRRVKPINLDVANRKQDPWFISRPFNPEEFVSRQIRQRASKSLPPDLALTTGIPKKLVVFRNGDPSFKRNLILNRNRMLNFDVLLKHISELMNFPVLKLYTTNGKRIDALYPVKYKFEAVVAAGQEGYRLRKYADSKSPQIPNRVQHKNVIKTENKNYGIKLGRRQWLINSVSPSSSKTQGYSTSSDQFDMNDNKTLSGSSFYIPEDETDAYKNYISAREEKIVIPSEDDIEKSIFVNEDGSITVEMRVHLQIKEKETIQWTTTINRSSMCNRKSNACKAKLESNVESADLTNVHSHYNSETMHFENLDHEQDFDDLCTPQNCTGQIEHDKGGHYDIWQNSFLNTNEDLPELGAEFKPLYCCKGSPGHGNVTQAQVSLESMTANPDTESGANIVQLSNLEEPGLGESIIENCNEHFLISNTKESCERRSDAVSEELQTWKEVNVNNHTEEEMILDKNTSFVGKATSSKYSELCHEDQYTVLKMINSHNRSENARNIFLRYWEEIGCDDTDNNVAKLNLRPTSADAIYSNSKRGIKYVKRPTSASFKYSRSYASIHNEKSSLSSRMGCSHTSTERMDINTNCTYSSESCEARMSLFLEDLNSVSKCSQSSTVRNQDCIKTSDKVEMPTNTGSNNSASTNEDERAFCSSEEASPVNNDLALSSGTDEQNCRDHTSENSKLFPEYSNHSQQPQLLDQLEETDILSDDCTTHSSSQEAIEMVDTGKYQNTEFNPVEMPNETNVTFHVESGGDGSVSHNSTGLIPPKEGTNSDLSLIPIVCPARKEPSNTELLDNKLQRMEDQKTPTISNSSATPSKSENIPEVDICQDNFSEGKQTTLLIACTEFNLYQAEGVQCSAVITEKNSDFPESSSLQAEIDSDSSSGRNVKQITGVNSSSIESDIQQNSSNPSRKKWKNGTKKNGKILNITTAGKQDFKHDAESSKPFSILVQQKEQEIYDVDIPQVQTFVQNRLRMSATSEIVCCDFNLRSYPQTEFEEERTVDDLGRNIIKESNKLPDDDSDFINQTKRFGSEMEVPFEHRLVQISAKAVSDVNRVYEVPDNCNNDGLLQSQVSVAKGEVKPASIPNEIQYRTSTKMTDAKLDVIDFAKETVDTAIQNGIGLDSEMVEEKGPIDEHDLSQVLCKLQSAIDVIKCNSEHRFETCLEKSYERPNMSEHLAATLSTSSKVLLAWLAIMNLNVNVPASPDRAKLLMNNCNCSYIITFLQSIRHVIKLQETDDLKQCFPSLQKYATQFVKVWQNEHKEEHSCAFENDPKSECPVQTGTSDVEKIASFDAPQLINTIENEKYLYTQNVIERLEHVDEAELKEDVKYVANILSIKEDKTKETANPELLSSKDNSIFSDHLEDQIRTNCLFQNEDPIEETTVMSKEWVEKETVERDNCTNGCDLIEEFASLQHIEDMRREDVAKNKEFLYNNCINSNKNRHSGKLRDNETNNHFTCANATEKTDELSTASDTIHLQNVMHHKSPLANDICESKHINIFCQRECIRRSNSCEIPACRLSVTASVVSDNDIENGKKTGNKQLAQTRETCENPFSEGEAGIKTFLPCTYPSIPSNRNVKQCLERQQTSDLSEENQEIASDYNSQASSEMTTEGEEDVFVKTKHFSANFVRKATEKLYGKSNVVSKHFAYEQPPYVCVEPKTFFQTGRITDNTSCKISSCSDKSNPAGTWGVNNELLHNSSLDKGRTFENSQENSAQSENDGVYIEKGRWFLKENHLVRKSPPLNMGMYGNLDTTSVDTAFDNTSDDSAYSHVNAMHSGPPLSELSSSDIEGTKSKPMCNYFNMSHGSDSEPFPDLISEKSNHVHICSGSHLTKKNDSNKQSAQVPVGAAGMYSEANDNDSSFTSAEFHMFDNKVSPMVQPLAQGTVVEQPSRETVRTLQNPDSLDKLHFLCGQHCPILTAVIEETNEESRRFVYQKKSDLENQWILHSENGADIFNSGKFNDLATRKENCSVLNKHSIDGTISDIINQFKTQSFENDIKRIKLSLDAKYLGANLETSKVPVYSEETELKHKDKPFCSHIQAEKLCIKRIVEQWFMKHAVENKIKAVKGRENGLSFPKGEDCSGRQTNPYIRHTRGNTANNYVTIPLLENRVIGQTMSSGNISTNEAAVNSEKEPFCETHKEKLEKHKKCKWKVTIFTSDLPSAGTTAQAYITLYGDEGSSKALALQGNAEEMFQRGHKDIFTVNAKNIGKLYKIRIGHNNAGEFPGWHCESIYLKNIYSGQEYHLAVDSWMDQNQDDGEISREVPVMEDGQEVFPVIKYEILVVTGDLWNGGTEANIFIVIYGKRGDTGSRQLIRSNNPLKFRKGQTDIFSLKAVHLGNLQKLVIGHDGLGAGNGWFLEKVTVTDTEKDSKGFIFPCHRWLDQAEDDGKIARELFVAENFTFPEKHELEFRRKEIWAAERWKFTAGRILQFYCKLTGKFIRLMPDSTVDATAEKDDRDALFEVFVKKKGIQVFSSVDSPNLALAIDRNQVIGSLHSLRRKTCNAAAKEDSDIIKDFIVHVKDAFQNDAVVLLNTSLYQSLCITSDGTCLGTGKQSQMSYLRVHEVSPKIYMFESVQNPQMFIQIKDGKCDGLGTGDEYCHFKVQRNLENATVSLESMESSGMYLGLLSDGHTNLFAHTGESNMMFYPQVINMKKKNLLKSKSLPDLFEQFERKPKRKKPFRNRVPKLNYSSEKWKVVTWTGDTGTDANVSIWVYGSKGLAGPMRLQKSNNTNPFLSNQTDEFQINVKDVGKIYKIRMAHDDTGIQPHWKLEKILIKQLSSGRILNFNADRWLSRQHDDGEIVREFPLSRERDGKPFHPVVKYQVQIHTGELEEPDSYLPIHICIYGERGDTGLRYLYKFDKPAKFKKGQVVIFQVEAVSLGKLQKVLLRSEADKRSQRWYCEKVVIKEEGDNKLEYVFNCDRWFPYILMDVVLPEIELILSEIRQDENSSSEEISQGDKWEVIITTGNFHLAGTEAAVIIYVYGDNGTSGPIILGTGKEQLFKPGSTDIFKINLTELGEMYKIRIGHDNSSGNSGWFLDDVKLKELATGRVISLPVNRWLDENQDDGDIWREFPVANLGEKHLPVLFYHIHVFTGNKSGAETNANVYINIFGERGDLGKRKLHKSQNNQIIFQKDQMDTFTIEAVSIGIIKRIVIGHDGVKAASGWFLDKVIINYEENNQEFEDVFICSRWLDINREDQKTERELIAKRKFKISLETAKDSMQPEDIKTTLVAYGSKGKSDEIVLSSDNPEVPHFLPGAIDDFFIFIEDVGDIYKIRVNGEELGHYVGWHLRSIILEDLQTKQVYVFNCNTWLSATKEDKELVKEFSVTKEGINMLPVNHYLVYVHIGDCWGAETYANVFVTLHGERGDTGIRKLDKSLVYGEMFQQNKTDSFLVKAVSLGQLTRVIIGHDGEGYGAGMYLKMIIVRESKDSDREWVFPCWSWLDDHIGTKQTVRELALLGERLAVSPKGGLQHSSDIWIINITSSDVKSNSGLLQILITVYGKDGQRKFTVGIADETTQVKAELAGVGLVYKLRVTPKPDGLQQPWKLDSINMKCAATKEELWFTFNWWVKPTDIQSKELPALNPLEDPLPEVEYSVHIYTGDEANTSAVGTVFINVHGDKGDSGKQLLTEGNSKLLTFVGGKVNIFKFNAVCLGKLYDIIIGYSSQKQDAWFLEKVMITEGEMPVTRSIFMHNNWIGKHQKDNEFPEVIIHLEESADIFTNPLKHFTIDRKEQWHIWILRLADSEEIIHKPEISMIVFGTKGKSPMLEIANMKNLPFEISLEGVGEIEKVSFVLLNPYLNKGRRLFKLRMKNLKTKQELGFNTERCWLFEEHGTETVTELAAVRPDRQPLRDISYSVRVLTGNLPAASTDANVSIMILGEHGDTCKRKLRRPHSAPFEKHQVSVFNIQAVDLGIPTQVHAEHDGAGYGAGWYLETIIITEPTETGGANEYVFPCQQWLDSEVADRQTKRKLKLLGKVSNESKMLTENLQGSWDAFVVTSDLPNSGTDVEVALTVCCKNGSAAPIILKEGSLKRGYTYKTSINIDEQLGAISKVRLEREESRNEDFWRCQKVVLQHQSTKEVLEFLFLRNLSPIEGYTVAELPVIINSADYLTVKEYVLCTITGSTNNLGADSDVYITLKGTLGDTGKRKLKTQPGNKEAMINTLVIEAIDVGTLQELTIQMERGSDLYLEKIIVKEGKYAMRDHVFMARDWLHNPKDINNISTLTLPITELQSSSEYHEPPSWQQIMSGGKWKIYLTNLNGNTVNRIDLEMVIYGKLKKSNPIPLSTELSRHVDFVKFEINLPEDIGNPWKIRLGLGKPGKKTAPATSPVLLRYFKMQNVTNLATFSYPINESLPVYSNGDKWLEFPIEWPQKLTMPLLTYQIKMHCSDFLDMEHPPTVSLCLYGAGGDTGDRSLLKPLHKETGGRQSYLFEISAVELGKLRLVELYISSIKNLKIYIKDIYITEVTSPKMVYVFTLNENIAVHSKKPPIIKKIPLSGMLNHERKSTHSLHSVKDPNSREALKELDEYLVQIYTEDEFGESTNVNVYIVLFGDKAHSDKILLTETLDHVNPFRKGQVDKFKIKTDLLGSLYKIEIGHDAGIPGSGWFLEKVEITNTVTKENLIFPCNRWLTLDIGTVVQLYLRET
ncbi:uncharacterized protein LOC119972132 [Scyliorhinus canicula]|uniref:uncharacterized protein LOC119972132 n=1 Tax=Scyliorhinus canicula TaxID=7830 RepID=UPI0018F423B3|nr:uncharacterized protein LOC119972132 [Scyliorhinus canicula]